MTTPADPLANARNRILDVSQADIDKAHLETAAPGGKHQIHFTAPG